MFGKCHEFVCDTLTGVWKSSFLFLFAASLWAARVAIVVDGRLPQPAQHGVEELQSTVTAKGHTVVAGSADAYIVIRTSAGGAGGAEAYRLERTVRDGKPAVTLSAGGPRGLMYAALDVAERIGWTPQASPDPLARIRNTDESPYLQERGISMYTMQRAYWESRLYDENHWKRYFDLLARSRINTFTIIFGYENGGFMAPLYPYFFDVAQHPEVRLIGITAAQQQRNIAAFRALIRIAHERGIDVIPAVWDHIYRGGVQGGGIAGANDTLGKDVPGLVSGVTEKNLAPYTIAALRRFFEVFPDIDGIEFRMHAESGLKPSEMAGFWHEVFSGIAKAKPGLRVTLRAKELPDAIIDDALAQGLIARVETKYWMEQMGMPFHPTHVNRENQMERRHGYADLLSYPQRYKVHWRLWSGGTTRLLLWGDPEYVRRYAESARLYGGNSFDINEMLATKMLGEPHDRAPLPILNPQYRFYTYEFERYWHFYQLWGRVTYNPQVSPEIWDEAFRQHFGAAAGPVVAEALHTASRVLPRIVAASYRYQLFPTTRGWAEMMRQGDLPEFATEEGTDTEQFQSPADAAKHPVTTLRSPAETSRWFNDTADAIVARTKQLEGITNKELQSTLADLGILAHLARYHAARLNGAVNYNLYRLTKNASSLDDAISREQNAIEAWKAMIAAAGDVYSRELAFGVHRVGFPRHWSEELPKLEAGLAKLRAEGQAQPATRFSLDTRTPGNPPMVHIDPAPMARAGVDLRVTARAGAGASKLALRYRHLTQWEDYRSVDMSLDSATGIWSARIPGDFIDRKWDLIYFIEATGTNGAGRNYPDLDVSAPYVIVPVER